MELELKHLAPYLPYELKLLSSFNEPATISNLHLTDLDSRKAVCLQLDGVPITFRSENLDTIKPILRPLSDLTKEIEVDGEFTIVYNNLELEKYLNIDTWDKLEYWINYLPFEIVTSFFKHHFDVFRLIEKGLAVDINTLEK